MPIFKVSTFDKSNCKFIKGLTLEDVLLESEKKLELPDLNYKIISELDGVEIEDDDILFELSAMSKQPFSLLLVPFDKNNFNTNHADKGGVSANESQILEDSSENRNERPNLQNFPAEPESGKEKFILSQDVMNLCPPGLIKSMNKKTAVDALDRRKLIANIADYMLHTLNNTSRGVAVKILSYIVEQSSEVFSDKIGDLLLGSGVTTLTAKVMNAIQYRKPSEQKNSKKRKKVLSDDSDAEEGIEDEEVYRRRDEYGCVAYAPILPEGETSETLNEIRENLCEEWKKGDDVRDDIKISVLIKKTYALQRAELNVEKRDLQKIFDRWPFLTDTKFLTLHADLLMGAKMKEIWNKSHSEMAQDIRKYFKCQCQNSLLNSKQPSSSRSTEKIEKMTELIQEAKLMNAVVKSKIPNSIVMFPLLTAYFQEDQDLLFRVFDVAGSDDLIKTKIPPTPILIVKDISTESVDQTSSSSFWNSQVKTGNVFTQTDTDFFPGSHGLVQTHPTNSVFQSGFGGIDNLGSRGVTVRPPRTRPLDYSERATAELRRNPSLSAPDECARACREGEPPRICYYHFTLEMYTVLGAACQVCTPNATNTVWSHCQCVLADGVERGILTANRMIPGPSIQVCEGDKVVIDVENHIEGMEVTLHWHGIFQRGSQYYDGVPFVTQCPIMQGTTFRYQWTAGNAGTHFWHAHTGLQKMDGLYGSVIVRQPPSKDPNSNLYDYDLTTHVVLISDWMHEDAAERYPGRLAVNVGQDPETVLINGKGQFRDPNTGFMTNTPLEVFTITQGRRYRFRLINSFGSVCPAQITIQGHTLTLIATDGEPVHPVAVNTIISFSGERYDFIINADQAVGAYWIQLRGLGECGIKRAQQLGILRYARGPYQPTAQPPTYDLGLPQGIVLNPLDAICNQPREDAICINQLKNAHHIDKGILQARPDVKIFLPFRFLFYRPEEVFQPNTYNRYLVAPSGDHVISLVDEISFTFPPAPPLSQIDDIPPEQFCNGDNRPADCGANCMCTHKVDIPHNAVVEVVLVDEVQQPNLSHPFHLHGYAFNVIGMGRSPDRNVKKINLKHALDLDRRGLLHREFNLPPAKDTIAVPNNGYVVFRFRADNPGYWLFHCHFLFHIVIGMNLILHVGTHADLPPVPPNFPTCGDHLPPITPPLPIEHSYD